MNLEMIQSLLRHLLGLGGGYVMGSGLFDAAQWDLVTGIVMGGAALVWSFFNKKKLRAAPAVVD